MRRALPTYLLLLAVGTGWVAAAPDGSVDWPALAGEIEAAFEPLDPERIFLEPMQELKVSRRAPYTDAARDEIEKRRAKLALERAKVLNERRKREDLVRRIGAVGDDRAGRVLIGIYADQLEEIDTARKNLDRYLEAGRIDINPGVDPGGVYWERWLGKERGAASSFLDAELRLRDLAFAEAFRLRTVEVVEWVRRNAAAHDRPEVREQMIEALAASGLPEDTAALGTILAEEREVWVRVLLLDAFARAKSPGAGPFVLDALADEAWPVRSAAVAAVRALDLRGRAAVDALIVALEDAEGRLRLELRNALAAATGQGFGVLAGEWRLWWDAVRADWTPLEAPAEVEPPDDDLPHLFGRTTTSRRIAVLLFHGKSMLDPVKRRALANDGSPAPEPEVDAAYRVAVWEVEEGLATLERDAEFVLVVYGKEGIHPSWNGLRRATTRNQRTAVGFAKRFEPEGYGSPHAAIETVLRLGVSPRVEDLALGGEGEVDTIFVVGAGVDPKHWRRVRQLRRVEIHGLDVAALRRLGE